MPEYDPKKLRPQDLRDSTVRSLGDAVNGLANVIKGMDRIVEKRSPVLGTVSSGITSKKKRLQNDSYSQTYGSGDIIEAVDRLRLSNAEWIKALGTQSKRDLRSKSLPKARSGGYVERSGEAYVHRGEVISPANMVKLQTQSLSNIEDKLSGMDSIGDNVQNIAQAMGGVKTNFLDSPLITTLLGDRKFLSSLFSVFKLADKLFREKRREKALGDSSSGRTAYFHYRSIQRSTVLETIAAATSATYSHVRIQSERQITLLKSIAEALGAKTPKATKGWGWKEITEPSGILEGLTRALTETGDIMDLIKPLMEARSKTGGFVGAFRQLGEEISRRKFYNYGSKLSGAFGRGFTRNRDTGGGIVSSIIRGSKGAIKATKGLKLPHAAEGGIVNRSGQAVVHRGEVIIPTKMQETTIQLESGQLQAQVATAGILNKIWIRISKFLKDTDKKYLEDLYFRKKISQWLNTNKTGEIRDAILNTTKSSKGGAGVLSNVAGAGAGTSAGAGAGKFLSGSAARTSSGFVSKMSGAFGRGFTRNRAVGGGIVSSIVRGGRGAIKATKVGRAALGLTKIAGIAGVGAAGVGATALGIIGGPVLLAVGILSSVIDGIMSVFRTGEIFGMAFKDTTLTMKISAFAGGVVDGLWKLIQIPFNLIAKWAGSDVRLPSLVKPISKMVNSVLEIFSPLVTAIARISKFLFKGIKLMLLVFSGIIGALVALPFNPDKSSQLLQKAVNGILVFIMKDFPVLLLGIAWDILGFITKAFVAVQFKLPALLIKMMAKVIDIIGTVVFETIPKLSWGILQGFADLLVSIPESISNMFSSDAKSGKGVVGQFIASTTKDILKSIWTVVTAIPFSIFRAIIKLYSVPFLVTKLGFKLWATLSIKLPLAIGNMILSMIKFVFVGLPKLIGNFVLQGVVGLASMITDLPKLIKNWLIKKAISFIQTAIDFNKWAENLSDSIDSFVTRFIDGLTNIDQYIADLPMMIQKFANRVVYWFLGLFQPSGKKSILGLLAKALLKSLVALAWKVPKALVTGIFNSMVRLISEVPFLLWKVIKTYYRTMWTTIPKTFGRLLMRAVNYFLVDPIVNTLAYLGNLLNTIPSAIKNATASFLPSWAAKYVNNLKIEKPRKLERRMFESGVNFDRLTSTQAQSSTVSERAVMTNNNLNNGSLGKEIAASSEKQVAAVSTSTNSIVNSNTSINNSKQDPFSRSPLWTNMNDIVTGNAV